MTGGENLLCCPSCGGGFFGAGAALFTGHVAAGFARAFGAGVGGGEADDLLDVADWAKLVAVIATHHRPRLRHREQVVRPAEARRLPHCRQSADSLRIRFQSSSG